MIEHRGFQVDYQGRKWSGSYSIDEQGLCVASAWGSKRQRVTKATDPKKTAQNLLLKILKERDAERR